MPDFRFRRLAYVALGVRSIEQSGVFLREVIGLDGDTAPAAGQHFFRCGNDHHNLVLIEGDAPGLARVAFEMESERDLAAAEAHLASLGLRPAPVAAAECAALKQGRSLRVTEPATGLTIELTAGMQAHDKPFQPTLTKIARLGHLVIGSPNAAAAVEFFVRQLNFRVSDQVEGIVTFMRCFPNPLHHSLGIAAAPANRLHHVNFMVTDIDDIGRALARLKRKGVPIVYGPGRHPPSGSIFLYFLDPDGMTFEFSFGMEEFPEQAPRAARVLPGRLDSLDSWECGPPDPRFAQGGPILASVGAV